MCWNWEVSICFAIGLSLGALFVYKRRSWGFRGTERDSFNWLLVLNLAFVQWWEFWIWLWVYPRDADMKFCPKQNIVFTAMVYFHGVLLWPPIVNTIAVRTTLGNKKYFAFPMLFGCLYTLLGIFDLLYSQFYLGHYTCGLDGRTFLQWSVALSQSRILPNGYDWFLFTAFPFIFYKPRPMGIFMVIYLLITFAVPYLLVTLGEAASIFCWLGAGIFLTYLAEPYIILAVETLYPEMLTWDLVSPILTPILIKLRIKEDKSNTQLRSPLTSRTEEEIQIEMADKKHVDIEDDEDVDTDTEVDLRESNEVQLP